MNKDSQEWLERLFLQSRSNCPEKIRNKIVDWESWAIHYFRDLWKDGVISNYELVQMVDKICSF